MECGVGIKNCSIWLDSSLMHQRK